MTCEVLGCMLTMSCLLPQSPDKIMRTANPSMLNHLVNDLWHHIMHLNYPTWFVVVMMHNNDDSYPTYTTFPDENPNSSQHTDNLYPTQWDGIQSTWMIENDLWGSGVYVDHVLFLTPVTNKIMRTANCSKLNHLAYGFWHYIMCLNDPTWFVDVMMYSNDVCYPTYTTWPNKNPNSSQYMDSLCPIQWDGI